MPKIGIVNTDIKAFKAGVYTNQGYYKSFLPGSRSANGMKLLNALYENPITDARKVSKLLVISPQSAYSLIENMEKRGLLYEFTHNKRGKRYMLHKYLQLFMK